eukprot:maker-scaffold_1-snap-gene-20.63-mRNA-1 protein AED:0.01 eAED:0.01 QI:419/1/1/1/0.5/0.33/3/157/350
MKLEIKSIEGSLEMTGHKTDLIVSIKARYQKQQPAAKGKYLQLFYKGMELEDEKYLGEYTFFKADVYELELFIPQNQPFSSLDYEVKEKEIRSKVKKKSLSDFFDPKVEDNEWDASWTKGDEYLSYPPVSKEAKGKEHLELIEKKHRSLSVFNETSFDFDSIRFPDKGRVFHSLYVCKSRGFIFQILHKLEGSWSGKLTSINKAKDKTDLGELEEHAVSCKFVYDPKVKCWFEQQIYTSRDAISKKTVFKYVPVGHGTCEVFSSNQTRSIVQKLVESPDGKIVYITGKNENLNKVAYAESIVINSDVEQERTRTITRFNQAGMLQGILTIEEKKVLDQDTGSIVSPNTFA